MIFAAVSTVAEDNSQSELTQSSGTALPAGTGMERFGVSFLNLALLRRLNVVSLRYSLGEFGIAPFDVVDVSKFSLAHTQS